MERCDITTATSTTSTADDINHRQQQQQQQQQRQYNHNYHRLSLHEAIIQLDLPPSQRNDRPLAPDDVVGATTTTTTAEEVRTVAQPCDNSHSPSHCDADASRCAGDHRTPSPLPPPWRPPQTADAPTPQANMLLSLGVKLRSMVGHGGGAGRRQHRHQTSASSSPTSPANFLLPSSFSGGGGGRHGRDYRAASFSNDPSPSTVAAGSGGGESCGESSSWLWRRRSASSSKAPSAIGNSGGALMFFRGDKRANASRRQSPNFSSIRRTDTSEERRGSGASTASEMETHENDNIPFRRLSVSEVSAACISTPGNGASASAPSYGLSSASGARRPTAPTLKSVGRRTLRYGAGGERLPSSMAASEFHSLFN